MSMLSQQLLPFLLPLVHGWVLRMTCPQVLPACLLVLLATQAKES